MKKITLAVIAAFGGMLAFAGSPAGLYQKIYNTANESSADPADGGTVIASGARFSTCVAGNPSISYTDEATGVTHTLGANQTAGYKGVMMMTAGTTYTFAKNFDDNGHIRIVSPDGESTKVLDCTSWNTATYKSFTPTKTGWHTLYLYIGNGSGGIGPATAPFTSIPASLLWNDKGLASCTDANKAQWHRFVNDETEGTYLYTNIPQGLDVRGVPADFGTAASYGFHGYQPNDTVEQSTFAGEWVNPAGDVRATCTGYAVVQDDAEGRPVTILSGKGNTCSFVMVDGYATFQWLYDASCKVTLAGAEHGTAAGAGWYAYGAPVTLTATPDAGYSFSGWTGDGVPDANRLDNPLTLPATRAYALTPSFRPFIHVATTGSDDAGDGSEAKPYATIAKAISVAAEADSVFVHPGTYSVLETLAVSTPRVTVRGAADARDTTVLDGGATGTSRFFSVTGAGFHLENLTLTNAFSDASGGALHLSGANPVVKNCVITGCRSGDQGGSVYLASGASGGRFSDVKVYDCASTNQGGAVYVKAENARFTRCTFDTCATLFAYSKDGKGTDGKARGGCFYVDAKGLFLDGCTITNCVAGRTIRYDGGAFYGGSTTVVSNSFISGCAALRGGLSAGATITFVGGTIADCQAVRSAGTEWDYPQGHFCYGGTVSLSKCTICNMVDVGNTVMFADFSNGLVSGCVITNLVSSGHPQNSLRVFANGKVRDSLVCGCKHLIFMQGGGTVERCVFRNNRVDDPNNWAEATQWFLGATLRNVLWMQNDGPLAVSETSYVENCTVIGNKGGMRVKGKPYIKNCLVWDTSYYYYDGSRYTGSADLIVRHHDGAFSFGDLVISNSVFKGGHSVHTKNESGSEDILARDPSGESARLTDLVLADPKGPRFVDAANGDYHLQRKSLLRDGGIRLDWMADATDLDGNPRCLNRNGKPSAEALPDVGCYECAIRTPGCILLIQ